MNRVLYILILTITVSCAESQDISGKILSNDKKLKELFLKSTFLGRDSQYIFEVYYKNNTTRYSCILDSSQCEITSDTTISSVVLGFTYDDSVLIDRDNVCDHLRNLNNTMSKYSIKGYRTDWRDTGILLKLYLQDGSEMFYAPDGSTFLSSYAKLEKLNNGWFIKLP